MLYFIPLLFLYWRYNRFLEKGIQVYDDKLKRARKKYSMNKEMEHFELIREGGNKERIRELEDLRAKYLHALFDRASVSLVFWHDPTIEYEILTNKKDRELWFRQRVYVEKRIRVSYFSYFPLFVKSHFQWLWTTLCSLVKGPTQSALTVR